MKGSAAEDKTVLDFMGKPWQADVEVGRVGRMQARKTSREGMMV